MSEATKASLLDYLGLLREYSDELIALAGVLADLKLAKDNHERALVLSKAAKVITSQTPTEIDDDLVELIEAALNCPEIKAAMDKLIADLKKQKAA